MKKSQISAIIKSRYKPEEYPALNCQIEQWGVERPLEGLSILDATPVYRNTMAKYLALLAAGAELNVGISDVMAYNNDIKEFIIQTGIPVVKAEEGKGAFDIILDCAASFAHWEARKGYVELTRSGVEVYRQSSKPVFLADSGRIKKIETSLGTGESYFRAMNALGYDQWSGKKLVVFGSGKVGRGIIAYGNALGADICVVTDPATFPLSQQNDVEIVDYRDTSKVMIAVKNAYALVTATGVANALERNMPLDAILASQAIFANMGVEDEFGVNVPVDRVLNKKVAINFMLEEPTHLKYIDATMALHNAGAVYIATTPNLTKGLITPPTQLEDELLAITRKEGIIAGELTSMF